MSAAARAVLLFTLAAGGARAQQSSKDPFTITHAACPARAATTSPSAAGTASDSSHASASFSAGATDNSHADVVLVAEATIGQITFASQPHIEVRLCGGLDSLHVLARRNLPDRIVPGTTYRDVFVAVEILGRVNADCITEQWLGKPDTKTARAADATTAAPQRPSSACASVTSGANAGAVRRP